MSEATKCHPHHDGYLFALSDDGSPICPKCGYYHLYSDTPRVTYTEYVKGPGTLAVSCARCGFTKLVPTVDAWIEGRRDV